MSGIARQICPDIAETKSCVKDSDSRRYLRDESHPEEHVVTRHFRTDEGMRATCKCAALFVGSAKFIAFRFLLVHSDEAS